jgi:hypothetical protein
MMLLAGAGCAAPFSAIKAETHTGKIVARFCGASAYRAETVIATMDGPPLGPTGSTSGPPREATMCVQLENGGARPLQVNRNLVHLHCGKESYSITADRDDVSFIVPPSETRKFKVTFQYGSEILSGRDVELRFDDALTREEHAVTLPPLVLRRQ